MQFRLSGGYMINKKEISKLEGLLYLYALSKSGSKREVAEKLCTSVDTFNKYISDLEDDLKTKFLKSSGRGTVITPEGERILQVSDTIVKALRSLDDYASMAASCRGIVRLGMPDAIADYLGTDGLFDFFENYPEIHVENNIANKMPNMNTLEADICIDFLPPGGSDLVLVAAKKIKCGLFAAPKYIEKYGLPADMDDLILNHRICDKDNHELYITGWKDVKDRARHLIYVTNSIFSLRAVLQSGLGIGISSFPYARAGKLVHIAKPDFDFCIPIYLMAHKDTKDMPRIRVVLDYIKNLFELSDQDDCGCEG